METTTPDNLTQYRACLDLILSSALKGEMKMDKAFAIIDAMNLSNAEAFTRGYNTARDTYKSY